jgi:cysteine synthase B
MTITRQTSRKLQLKSLDPEGLEALVGNTPLIRMGRMTAQLTPNVQIWAKAEWFNPSGSIKDRPAVNILRAAIANGDLGNGRRLLDSTSGNMGIAYATFGASMGIAVTLCVPANASPERLTVLRALGAEVVLTDPSEGSDGAMTQARRLAAADPERYWYANQYDNPANWQAHYLTTGPELLSQTSERLTHLVVGLGTTGTLVGTGRYLKENSPGTEIVAVQPDSAFHGLEGLKHLPTAIRPKIYDSSVADRTLQVSTEDAHAMVRRLARDEGLLVGISSGAAAVAALRVAASVEYGNVVVIFPDAGYKYLSERQLWSGK